MNPKRNIPKFIVRAVCAALLASGMPAPVAWASLGRNISDDTLRIDIGYFLPKIDTNLRVDSPSLGVGTEIDAESDLGLEEDLSLGRIDGYFRLARRHRIQFANYRMNRDRTRTLERDIQFKDVNFPAGTSTTTNLSAEITELSYAYSFIERPDVELSGTIGVHQLQLDTRLRGSGGLFSESTAKGPLPLIGLDLTYAYTSRLLLGARAQYFSLSAGDFDGRLRNLRLSAEYYSDPKRNVGFGIGYNDFELEVDVKDTDFNGRFDWAYGGFQVYTIIGF
jgi:hypothetical protein